MDAIKEAQRVLDIEANAILEIKGKIGEDFVKAVKAVCECQGKLIVAGIGKSGHIAKKISSTFSSTGTPAVFLHAAESSHGDLGVIGADDCVLIISNSGQSSELTDLLNFVGRKGLSMVAMTGNMESPLAQAASMVLDIGISEEACPLKLAPTSSSTATLALGDALAMAVLQQKGFRKEDFAEFHPGGSLGKRLLTRVRDLMHGLDSLPLVSPEESLQSVLPQMTSMEVRGVLGVVNDQRQLVGIVTDGDLRRHFQLSKEPLSVCVKDIMSTTPKVIEPSEMAVTAMAQMEKHSIQTLFVVEEISSLKPVGLIHLQDLLKAKIR